jgi:hypothetical protein
MTLHAPVPCRHVVVSPDRTVGSNRSSRAAPAADNRRETHIMGYGIGGILVLILVILAIIYFAKRV